MYLLDTNIISELRKPRPHSGVVAWLESTKDAELMLAASSVNDTLYSHICYAPSYLLKSGDYVIDSFQKRH